MSCHVIFSDGDIHAMTSTMFRRDAYIIYRPVSRIINFW